MSVTEARLSSRGRGRAARSERKALDANGALSARPAVDSARPVKDPCHALANEPPAAATTRPVNEADHPPTRLLLSRR